MDEQNHSSSSMAAAIDSPSGESSGENAKQDINAALSNIDNKKGKLTDLLLRVFEQNEPSVQPVEGERPTGSERQASAHGAENNKKNVMMSLSKASAQRAENGRANLMLSLRKTSALWADIEHQWSRNLKMNQTLTHVAHEVSDHVTLKLTMISVFMQGIAQERRQT